MPSLNPDRIICDPEDEAKIKLINWTVDSDGRVRANIEGKTVRLHQFVMPGHEMIDHKNGNQCDVRKENLRPATTVTNGYNRGKTRFGSNPYKGVHERKDTKKNKWMAHITVNKKRISLGNFPTAEQARDAYEEAAKKHHGEFYYGNRQANS